MFYESEQYDSFKEKSSYFQRIQISYENLFNNELDIIELKSENELKELEYKNECEFLDKQLQNIKDENKLELKAQKEEENLINEIKQKLEIFFYKY